MVREETLNGHHGKAPRFGRTVPGSSRPESDSGGVSRVVRDAALLARLQSRLFAEDFNAWKRRSLMLMGVLGLALLLAIGAVPIALMGLSYWLASVLSLPLPTSYLAIGGLCLGLAIALATLAVRGLSGAFREFDRSRSELNNNFEWLIQTISRS